jgi:hypothetical protein
LNSLNKQFQSSLLQLKKKYRFHTAFGLLSIHRNKQASRELNILQVTFLENARRLIYKVFGEPTFNFQFNGRSWSAKTFAQYYLKENRVDLRFINIIITDKKASGRYVSDRYAGSEQTNSFLTEFDLSKLEKLLVTQLEAGEPIAAGFYMAERHLDRRTMTFNFKDETDPVILSKGDSKHFMTIIGYERNEAGNIEKWIVSNNSSLTQNYYFDRIALRKLLISIHLPLSETEMLSDRSPPG